MTETDPLAEEWSRKVRAAREERRMTQDEFARLIGTTTKSVSSWERARVVPRLATRRKLERWIPAPDETG